MLRLLISISFMFLSFNCFSSGIKGRITDTKTGEELVGSTLYIKELKTGTISGLDGTYLIKNVPEGRYTLSCSYISYSIAEKTINIGANEIITIDFSLELQTSELSEVSIVSYTDKSTDISARSTEKNADKVLNVVSAKTIELSPDLDVAAVVQRMSGISLDKNSSSTGQYALLRGMDKRYNYTLVNGIKIPSTHNKHRYVSLDMFPSDMIDRIEVYKALTPNLEGDAIGGVINLVMKNAPEKFSLQVNGSAGFSQFFADKEFQSFNTADLNSQSPYERNVKGYYASPNDFSKENLVINTNSLPVNYYANVTAGNRFFNKKLGWIVSGSLQNSYTGTSSLYFEDDLSRDGSNLPVLKDMQERIYNELRRNLGIHNKFDYSLNKNHRFQFYAAYIDMNKTQIREVQRTDLVVSYDPDNGDINRSHSSRLRFNNQSLMNFTLQGDHQINGKIKANWSAVYSSAKNKTPEEATITYGNSLENNIIVNQYIDFDGSTRIWRRNSDTDKAVYLNLTYTPEILGFKTEITAGGLYRQKKRTSFYNKYTLNAIKTVTAPDTSYTSFYSEKGVDWNTFDEIQWRVYNPRGTVAVGENYDANEVVAAGYFMFRSDVRRFQFTGGLRIENTSQGYYMQYPIGEPKPDGNQKYTELLPSLHIRYALKKKQNIRLSYYKAINKPGFQEIVPYVDTSEEPVSAGNPDLKHATSNNLDLRYEFFPSPQDQIMAGIFYKNIKNPIEFAFDKFMNVSQNIVYTPINSDQAINYGVEIDIIKFYREWGISGNYTLTRSTI